MDFYEKQHIQKLTAQQGVIKFIFDEFIRSSSVLLTKWSMVNSSSVWVGNMFIENTIDNLLSDMHDNMLTKITGSMTQSWNRGNDKADDLVTNYIKGMSIKDTLREKMMQRNAEALKSMINHKDQYGLTISNRVWNITENAKTNLEYYLQSGLSTGRPAALISQDIRQMLNNPDKRFRRVRNDKGELVPSKPMEEYHPGQGVYRSAAKNAQRLAATETNRAFRMADHDRWNKMDFVLGYEIERSPMHIGPCPVCDPMVGKYPKEYLFTGFHPICHCVATPILLGPNDFADYLLDETISDDKYVKEIPSTARQWVENYRERAKGWSKEPLFISENRKYFGKLETNTYTKEEKKFTRAKSTKKAMDRAVKELHDLYPDIPNTELAAIHHYTKSGGNYRQLNKQLSNGTLTEFNMAASELISNGLSKLPNFEGTVYRGTVMPKKKFDVLYQENEFIDERFVSASKDVEVVTNHFMKTKKMRKNDISVFYQIKSKKGKDIENISEFNGKLQSENQKEVLFDKDTKFKIIDISLNNNEATLIVEEL